MLLCYHGAIYRYVNEGLKTCACMAGLPPPPFFYRLYDTRASASLLCFSSDALSRGHDMGMISDVPATMAAVKNPSSKIVYDEYNHERFPPGDPSKRAFAYFVLSGGRFVLSMSASR
ncbi:hypothetical protein Gotur_013059, partial [Gossypium turneri]